MLTELKNRGVADVCIVVCDGLKHLPDAIGEVWPQAIVLNRPGDLGDSDHCAPAGATGTLC